MKFCQKCANQMEDTEKFCQKCGVESKVQGESSQTPSPAAKPKISPPVLCGLLSVLALGLVFGGLLGDEDKTTDSKTLDTGSSSSENSSIADTLDSIFTSKRTLSQEEISAHALNHLQLALVDNEIVLTEYTGTATAVEIPDIVTSIGDEAFYNCSALTSVTVTAGSYGETYMMTGYSDIQLNYT